MPFVIPFVGAVLAETSSAIAIGASFIAPGVVTAAGVESVLTGAVATMALNAASSALRGSQGGITERISQGPFESRRLGFGKVWTAGRAMAKPLTWPPNASYKNAEWLIALEDHRIGGISSFAAYGDTFTGVFVDGYPVQTRSYDAVKGTEIIYTVNPQYHTKQKDFTSGAGFKFFFQTHFGEPGQTADQWLVNNLSASGRWDATAVAKGISYIRASGYYDSDVFTGRPDFNFYIDGMPLYDPSKDTTVGGDGAHRWGDVSTYVVSANPAVIAYNIARGIFDEDGKPFYGCFYTADDLPLDFWMAAISDCNDTITDKDGSTSPRYSCGFEIEATRDARDALKLCETAMAGRIVEDRGQLLVFAGVPQTPLFTFSDDDMVRDGDHHYDSKLGLDNLRNIVTGKFVDVSQCFAQVDAPPRQSVADILADGGIPLIDDLDLSHIQHGPTAQRIMAVQRARHRAQATVVRTLGPAALNARTGQWIAGTSKRWSGVKLFEITSEDIDTNSLLVTLALREVSATLGVWNPSTDELDGYSVSLPAGDPADPLLATGISAAPLSSLGGDSSAVPGFTVTFTPPDDPTADVVWIEVLPPGAANSFYVLVKDPELGTADVTNLTGLTTYAYRVLLSGVPGRAAVWSDWYTVTTPATVLPGGLTSPDLVAVKDVAIAAEQIGDLKSATADLEQAADDLSLTNIESIFGAAADKQEAKEHLEAKVGDLSASIDQQLLAISNATDALAEEQATFTASLAGKADGSTVTAALTRITNSEDNISVLSGEYASLSSAITGKADASALFSLLAQTIIDEGNIATLAGQYATLSATIPGLATASALSALVAQTTIDEGNIATISGQYATLLTTVGDHTTSINTITQSLNGVAANWSVSIDTNGVINGMVRLDGGASGSHFDVLADAFRVWQPGGAVPAFSIQNNQAVFTVPIQTAGVGTSQLAANSVSTIAFQEGVRTTSPQDVGSWTQPNDSTGQITLSGSHKYIWGLVTGTDLQGVPTLIAISGEYAPTTSSSTDVVAGWEYTTDGSTWTLVPGGYATVTTSSLLAHQTFCISASVPGTNKIRPFVWCAHDTYLQQLAITRISLKR